MLKSKKKSRSSPEINASSMADIAFLLLVFFLVTTTIATDKGVTLTLPPYEENPTDVKMRDRDVLNVLINFRNELLVEGEPSEIKDLPKAVEDFLDNIGQPEYPETRDKAIVSLKADRGTDYTTYLAVLDIIKAEYHKKRAEAVNLTVEEYLKLNFEQNEKDRVINEKAKAEWPMNISEAEPSKVGG